MTHLAWTQVPFLSLGATKIALCTSIGNSTAISLAFDIKAKDNSASSLQRCFNCIRQDCDTIVTKANGVLSQ